MRSEARQALHWSGIGRLVWLLSTAGPARSSARTSSQTSEDFEL